MDITWQDSGKGPIDLPLASVHHLAIQAGFVFDIDDSQPLSKRANLQSKNYFGIMHLTYITKNSLHHYFPLIHLLILIALASFLSLQNFLTDSMSILSPLSNKNSLPTS